MFTKRIVRNVIAVLLMTMVVQPVFASGVHCNNSEQDSQITLSNDAGMKHAAHAVVQGSYELVATAMADPMSCCDSGDCQMSSCSTVAVLDVFVSAALVSTGAIFESYMPSFLNSPPSFLYRPPIFI